MLISPVTTITSSTFWRTRNTNSGNKLLSRKYNSSLGSFLCQCIAWLQPYSWSKLSIRKLWTSTLWLHFHSLYWGWSHFPMFPCHTAAHVTFYMMKYVCMRHIMISCVHYLVNLLGIYILDQSCWVLSLALAPDNGRSKWQQWWAKQ